MEEPVSNCDYDYQQQPPVDLQEPLVHQPRRQGLVHSLCVDMSPKKTCKIFRAKMHSPATQILGVACHACRQDRQEQLQAVPPQVLHQATELAATPPQGWISSKSLIPLEASQYMVLEGSLEKFRKKEARYRCWPLLLENNYHRRWTFRFFANKNSSKPSPEFTPSLRCVSFYHFQNTQ